MAACTYNTRIYPKCIRFFNTFYYYLVSLRQLLPVLPSDDNGDLHFSRLVRFFSYSSFPRAFFGATLGATVHQRLASRE